jgi:hypothetical protein
VDAEFFIHCYRENKTGTAIENICIEHLNVNPAKHLSRLKFNIMKTKIFNLLLAGLFISGVVLTGCSKSDAMNDLNNNSAKIAANNPSMAKGDDPADGGILNHDLRITSAIDNGTDITQQFNFYTFRFVGTYPGGQAQVWNDLLAQIGSWSANLETNFTISYPTDIFREMAFLNRTWTVVENSGTFTLTAGDGDTVQFIIKKE